MFTGLISSLATLVTLERKNRPLLTLRIRLEEELRRGDSLAVNGVCLTVVEKKSELYRFNLSPETIKLANFTDLPAGSLLNVELPLKAGGFLGGHLVSGHIDGTVRLRSRNRGDQSMRLTFTFREPEWAGCLVKRGSVVLDGVSLTVVEVHGSWFGVEIIPHTWQASNLQYLRIGQRVNIELDMVAKYIQQNLAKTR